MRHVRLVVRRCESEVPEGVGIEVPEPEDSSLVPEDRERCFGIGEIREIVIPVMVIELHILRVRTEVAQRHRFPRSASDATERWAEQRQHDPDHRDDQDGLEQSEARASETAAANGGQPPRMISLPKSDEKHRAPAP